MIDRRYRHLYMRYLYNRFFLRWSKRRTLTLLGLAAGFWLVGLVWFAENLSPQETPEKADAIIVLTGGRGRLAEGMRLLKEEHAQKLLISGVNQKVKFSELAKIDELQIRDQDKLLACCITLGYRADDTIGNALESSSWMQAAGFKSAYLVTAHYHIERALVEFKMIAPDLIFYPVPVAPDAVKLKDWWQWPGTATLIVTEYNKYLISLVRLAIKRLVDM